MPEKVLQWLNQMHDAGNFEYSIDPQETLKELFNKYPMFKASNTYFHDLFYTEILPGFFEACVWEYSRRIPKDPSLSYWKLECKTIKPFDTTGIDERMVGIRKCERNKDLILNLPLNIYSYIYLTGCICCGRRSNL